MIPWGPDPDQNDAHLCDTIRVQEYPFGDTALSCRVCGRDLAYLVSETT